MHSRRNVCESDFSFPENVQNLRNWFQVLNDFEIIISRPISRELLNETKERTVYIVLQNKYKITVGTNQNYLTG